MEVRLTTQGVEAFATSRLQARRLSERDEPFFSGLHGDEQVMANHGGVRPAEVNQPFTASNIAHWEHYRFGLWILSLTADPDTPIGWAALRWQRSTNAEEPQGVELTCLLEAQQWGRGLGTEVVRALVAVGHAYGLPVEASTEANHASARRVLEKAGFAYRSDRKQSGTLRSYYTWPQNAAPGAALQRTAPQQDGLTEEVDLTGEITLVEEVAGPEEAVEAELPRPVLGG